MYLRHCRVGRTTEQVDGQGGKVEHDEGHQEVVWVGDH